MSTKIRLICKWVPNFTIQLQMSRLQMRSELNCKKYNWVMKSFANETRLICTWVRYWFFAYQSWLVCKRGFICNMSLDTYATNESYLICKRAFPATILLLYFLPQRSPSKKNFQPHQKNTHNPHHIPHPSKIINTVVLFAATTAWLWQTSHPHPGEPLWKG